MVCYRRFDLRKERIGSSSSICAASALMPSTLHEDEGGGLLILSGMLLLDSGVVNRSKTCVELLSLKPLL